VGKAIHGRGVPTPDGAHPQDFTIDQLDPVVLAEDLSLGHAMVVLRGEPILAI
jgi:hypothetical protein